MTDANTHFAVLEFYPPEQGGRKRMPDLTTGLYRPHIVVQSDPDQTYLGVALTGGPESFSPNQKLRLQIKPLYENVDYSSLTPGVIFHIKEGAHTVGHGVFL